MASGWTATGDQRRVRAIRAETGYLTWPNVHSSPKTFPAHRRKIWSRVRWSSRSEQVQSTCVTMPTGGHGCPERIGPSKGPDSSLDGLGQHPVVHVAYEDVEAYARWAEKDLATEAEWEFAARGGLDGAAFTWGNEEFPAGKAMVNSWQGEFPWQNLLTDGYEGTSPVGSFPPNGYGLFDMAGQCVGVDE